MGIIYKGMTPAEYLTAINTAFDAKIANYTVISGTVNEIAIINNNLSDDIIAVGQSGNTFINALNNKFNEYDNSLSTPTDLSVIWVDDFARITFTESLESQCEIYEQLDDGNYVLCNTLNGGVGIYDYKCWQNSSYNFRLRFKNNDLYSAFAEKISIDTPQFVFYTDQRSGFTPITIYQIKSATSTGALGSNRIYWGDGTYDDYSNPAYESASHTYNVPGEYYIKIYGDQIYEFQFYEQALDGTDITKWRLPYTVYGLLTHLWGNGFVGDISGWTYPVNIRSLHLANNPITGNLDKLFDGSCQELFDFHMSGTLTSGNLSNWTLPEKMAHFGPPQYVTGDISHFRYPKNNDYKSWIFNIASIYKISGDITYLFDGNYEYLQGLSAPDQVLSGDLSGWFIGANYIDQSNVTLQNNYFTKCPRGNFYRIGTFNMSGNYCNSDEIDSILADIDTSVTANAPQYDCVYNFDGVNMGIPSAAGLASKASIEAKYAAAGKAVTINVNT